MYNLEEMTLIMEDVRCAIFDQIVNHPTSGQKEFRRYGPAALMITDLLDGCNGKINIPEEFGKVLQELGWDTFPYFTNDVAYIKQFTDAETKDISATEIAFEKGVDKLDEYNIIAEVIRLPFNDC